MKYALALIALILVGCTSAPTQSANSELFKKYIQYVPNQLEPDKRVEFFIGHPEDNKKHPVIVFVHAYQEEQKIGGFHQIEIGRFEDNIQHGYVSVSVSQPGFGGSDGPADFSGPRSQAALISVLDFVLQQPYVDVNNIALYGYSRGALTVALTSLKFRKFKVMILGGAQYDLEEIFSQMKNQKKKAEILAETGDSAQAFKERSLLKNIDHFTVPTLILHGEKDLVAPVEGAISYSNELRKRNVDVRAAIFPEFDHVIPTEKRYEFIYPFLEEFLSMPTLSPLLEQVYARHDSEENSEDLVFGICQQNSALCPNLNGKKGLSSIELKKEGHLRLDYDQMKPGSVAFFWPPKGKKEQIAIFTGRKTMDGDLIFLASGHPQKRGWVEVPLQSLLSGWDFRFNGWADL